MNNPFINKGMRLQAMNTRIKLLAAIGGAVRCSTELANCIPRVFMDDTPEDRQAIRPVINQIVI